MFRFIRVRRLVAPALGLGLLAAAPAASLAQEQQDWPRWEGAPQEAPYVEDGRILALSTLGAAGGWAGGVLTGAWICWNGCGGDAYDALVPVLLLGVAGGALGSAVLGCRATHEAGCTARVLPKAFLGSLVALAGAVVVASASDDGIAMFLTYSAVQGLLTSRALR